MDKQLNSRREIILKILFKAKYGYSIYNLMDVVEEDNLTCIRRELNCLKDYIRIEDRICCRECGQEYSTYHLNDKGRIYVHHIQNLPTRTEVYGDYSKGKRRKE